VHTTAENLVSKLEANLTSAFSGPELSEEQDNLLQLSGPGPLHKNGLKVEEVLNIISHSIYREGEGTRQTIS